MKWHSFGMHALLTLGPLALLPMARADLPKRNLSVEIRQVQERDATSYAAGSTTQASASAAQWLQVRNGEKASLRLAHTATLQWVQSVQATQSPATQAGNSPGSAPGTLMGVNTGMVMVESGQSLTVKPTWAGGNAPVVVEIELQTTQVQPDAVSPIPNQMRQTLGTVVEAPLGYWVVIATEGQTQASGVYSTAGESSTRKTWQIRVQAP